MEDIRFYLQYEKGQRAYADYFGFADRHPGDIDGIDELMPTEQQFHSFMGALKAVSPAPIYYVDVPGDRNGTYGHAENEVYVSWRISPVMCIRTALHEMAHAILHPWPGGVKPTDEPPRAVRETEAEGVAYLVCQAYGLDTSAYSIGYIKSWLRHLSDAEAQRSIDVIRQTADRLVTAIDAELKQEI